MLARRVMTASAKNTKPRMRLRWDIPTIRIARNELTRERNPIANARALGCTAELKSRDSHAMMDERSIILEMR